MADASAADDTAEVSTVDGASASAGAAKEHPARAAQRNKLLAQKREVGGEAVWSLSTAKPGNGVEQLRDSNNDTYWQSDGQQPHLINIQFHRKMTLVMLEFYLDYKLDESYTPKKITIKAGTTFHDLREMKSAELNEPSGWVSVPLLFDATPDGTVLPPGSQGAADDDPHARLVPLRTWFVQVCVVAMHQNGRDTHIRQVRVFGQRQAPAALAAGETTEFTQFQCIR